MQFEGDPIYLGAIEESSRSGWTGSSGYVSRRPVATQRLARCCGGAAFLQRLRLGREFVPLPSAAVLLLEAKKAAGEWRTGSLMPNPPFLMEVCTRSRASWVKTTWMIRAVEGGLHPLSTKVEGVPEQPMQKKRRKRVVVGDWRRMSWVTSLSVRSSFPGVCGGRSPGSRKQRQGERSICRIGPSILLGLWADGCPGRGFWLGCTRTLSGSV